MKAKTELLSLWVAVSLVLAVIGLPVNGQASAGIKPAAPAPGPLVPVVSHSVKNDVSPALRSIAPLPPTVGPELREIPLLSLSRTQGLAAPKDGQVAPPAVQDRPAAPNMPSASMNFEGVSNLNGVLPPDTEGDIGYDPATNKKYYVQWVNLSFAIWDVTAGTPGSEILVYGPVNGNTLWAGFSGPCQTTNDGDPITLYDPLAHRWLMSQFALPNYPNGPFYQCIAVSQTGDPTGAWYRYQFTSATKMNDYPKFGVWPDAYYMTDNQFAPGTGNWAGVGVFAFDRANMLAGNPATSVYFDLYGVDPGFFGMLPSDFDGTPPPAGAPNYFSEWDDAAWLGDATDTLRIWEFHVDWTNPANSTFGLDGLPNVLLPTANVDPNMCNYNRSCIPQPGTPQGLDAISDRLMYRLQYRNFGGYETLVTNRTVDANGADHAGIFWLEARKSGGVWSINQQGVYAPDSDHRWMGSAAMDHNGDLALGYSVSSSSVYPSVRYTGRLVGDPPGTLPQGETSLIAGGGSQTSSYARWGDYSMMSVDPLDDCTFWYTQEYIATTGSAPWRTRIGSFKFPSCSLGLQGKLAGAVSNASNSTPLVGASVQATSSPTQTFSTVSGAGGAYSMLIPVGTYTVTASAYGYLPNSISGASIASGTTTIVNIPLTPAPLYVVAGTIRDAATGWPLYASLNIVGYPAGAIWNNPVTGYYSVTLAGGNTYTFNVNAWVHGYTSLGRSAGPLTTNRTENFALSADPATCNAPGYSKSVAYAQNFEANNGGYTISGVTSWAWGMPTSGPSSAHSGVNVWATNLTGNYNDSEDGYVTSPNINMSAYAGQALDVAWWQWLQTENSYDYASVEVSRDGGASWTRVYGEVSGNIDPVWAQHTITLDPTYAVNNFRIRFHFRSDYSVTYPGWYVDDVSISARDCIPQAGGLVVGNTYDANTHAALPGATVVNDSGRSATTVATVDPAVDDSFYTLFSPAGSPVFTATKTGGYGVAVATPSVVLNDTIRRDFDVPAGRLSYVPPALEATLDLGSNATVPFTLTNDGGVAATYKLIELDKGSAPLGPFQKPDFVVKPFRQNFPTAQGLGLLPAPPAPPLAAGNVIQSWIPTGVLMNAWGIAYDSAASTVWVGDGWGTTKNIVEHQPNGTPTGRAWPYTWPTVGLNGPGDAAFNWNTGMLWMMNINSGVGNCIYEIDPATGYTGNSICPGGGTGFSVSQRGLAYNPSDDTWYAGSWNDGMIHHFNSTGEMLDEVNVGLSISGLAYNPDTQHLFVMVSASPNPVYVLDAANNYALLGQFHVSAGFGDYAGAGLEFDCDGNLWGVDQTTNTVYQFESGETTSMCKRDVPWLSESPISGTLPSLTNQPVAITFDAGVPQITRPGHYYAQLKIKHNTPYNVTNIPVTMTVNASATSGKLIGTVTGRAHCDATGAPLNQAIVYVQSSSGMTWPLTTNVSGTYEIWLNAANSPLIITTGHAGYVTQTVTGINVTAQQTTTQNFNLRLNAPCIGVNPNTLNVTVSLGLSRTMPLTMANTGAGAATFQMQEENRGFQIATVMDSHFVHPKPILPIITFKPPISPTVGWDDPNVGPITPMEGLNIPGNGVMPMGPWAKAQPMPTARARLAGVTGAGCQLYTIGGMLMGGGTYFNNNEVYDPQSKTWATRAPMPTNRSNMGGGWINNVIYVPGGYNGTPLSTHEAYDIANNSWSSKAPLPVANAGGVVAAVNSKIYYIGGSTNSGFVATTYEYDPTTNIWSAKMPAPEVFAFAGSAVLDGYIYIAGGWPDSTRLWRYDPIGNSWTVLAPMNQGRQSPGLVAAGGYLYAFGGGVQWTPLNSTEQYYPSSNIWTPRSDSPLAIGRIGMASGWVRGKIWGTGGSTGSGVENDNEYLDEGYADNCESDVPWLSESPISGTLVANSGIQSVNITFDAGVPAVTQPGQYYATLNILSNDPVSGNLAVPVTMTVLVPAYLTVTIVGNGTVNQTPLPPYGIGDVVTLTANAATDWAFVGWSGDLNGSTNPVAITLTGNKAVTATFVFQPHAVFLPLVKK